MIGPQQIFYSSEADGRNVSVDLNSAGRTRLIRTSNLTIQNNSNSPILLVQFELGLQDDFLSFAVWSFILLY